MHLFISTRTFVSIFLCILLFLIFLSNRYCCFSLFREYRNRKQYLHLWKTWYPLYFPSCPVRRMPAAAIIHRACGLLLTFYRIYAILVTVTNKKRADACHISSLYKQYPPLGTFWYLPYQWPAGGQISHILEILNAHNLVVNLPDQLLSHSVVTFSHKLPNGAYCLLI